MYGRRVVFIETSYFCYQCRAEQFRKQTNTKREDKTEYKNKNGINKSNYLLKQYEQFDVRNVIELETFQRHFRSAKIEHFKC